jgi:AraC-like DNA-binding protein
MRNPDLFRTDPFFFIEYMKHDANHQMTNFHYHNSYELYILEEGYHHMLVNDSVYDVTRHDVALFKPHVFHKSRSNQACARTCVYFTDRFLRLYFTERAAKALLACFDREVISLSKESFPRVKKLLLLLEKEDPSNPDNRIFVHLAEVLHILNENKSVPRMEQPPLVHPKFTPILSYIHQHYNKIVHIQEIADHFYMSKYYLCRIFKEATGVTLTHYINNIKIQNACHMLVNTDRSILEIGNACGFNSSMYFCKIFKEALSVTPSEFRRGAR